MAEADSGVDLYGWMKLSWLGVGLWVRVVWVHVQWTSSRAPTHSGPRTHFTFSGACYAYDIPELASGILMPAKMDFAHHNKLAAIDGIES